MMAAQNSYFVPGYGISRAVIQNEIRYHCGPEAIVRPYTFQVHIDIVWVLDNEVNKIVRVAMVS